MDKGGKLKKLMYQDKPLGQVMLVNLRGKLGYSAIMRC